MTDPLSAISEFRDRLRETNDPRLKDLEKFYVPIDPWTEDHP